MLVDGGKVFANYGRRLVVFDAATGRPLHQFPGAVIESIADGYAGISFSDHTTVLSERNLGVVMRLGGAALGDDVLITGGKIITAGAFGQVDAFALASCPNYNCPLLWDRRFSVVPPTNGPWYSIFRLLLPSPGVVALATTGTPDDAATRPATIHRMRLADGTPLPATVFTGSVFTELPTTTATQYVFRHR